MACRGQVASQEQGGLAEVTVAPGTENTFSSPSSNSAAANAAICAWGRRRTVFVNKILKHLEQNLKLQNKSL